MSSPNPASDRLTLDEVLQATQAITSRYPDAYYRELDRTGGYPTEFIKEAMAAGLGSVMVPAEYGGMGLGVREASVVTEEIHRSGGTGAMLHGQMFMMGILARHGSEDQKRRVLTEVAKGNVRLQSFSVTEPTAGTDTSKITTKARRDGNQWVITGQKVWTSRAAHTDMLIVLARTSEPKDPAKPFQGLSCFLVDVRDVDPKQFELDRKSTRLNSSHVSESRMPSSA